MDAQLLRDIAQLQRQVEQLATVETGMQISGATAFPSSPATGQLVYRTDRNLLYFYDGARWLTVQEYAYSLPNNLGTEAYSADGNQLVEIRTDYAPYITRVALTSFVATTNNGSNYWNLNIEGSSLAFANSAILTVTTAADAANTYVDKEQAPTSAEPANRRFLRLRYIKSGTPGNLSFSCTLYARLIG